MAQSPAYSQQDEVLFDRISVEEGLSNVAVNVILQDHQGFMWFGTNDGLCRYDGHEMAVFKNDPRDSASLSDNLIWSMWEDSHSNLWIGTYEGGLNRFDRITERFTRYEHDSTDPASLNHNSVKALYMDRSGMLWVGTFGGGLDRFELSTGRFIHHTADSILTLVDDFVISLLEDRNGILWVGTRRGGLYGYGRSNNTIRHFRHNPSDPTTVSAGPILALYEDHSGTLWVGTTNGLSELDPDRKSFKHHKYRADNSNGLSNPKVYAIAPDLRDQDYLWVATLGGGLNRLNKRNGTTIAFKRESNNPRSLSNDEIRTLYTDKTGTLWIGTYSGGVTKIHGGRKKFVASKHDPDNPATLSAGDVWSIYQDRSGTVWVGTKGGGLNRYDAQLSRFVHYVNDPDKAASLADDDVSSLLEDASGYFWVGTGKGGLDLMDRKTGTFKHFTHDPSNSSSISSNEIVAIREDRSRDIWIGTLSGLNRFDRHTQRFKRYLHNNADPRTLSNNRIFALFEDASGMLWIGTEGGGLNRFDPRSGEFARFLADESNPKSLSNNIVTSVFEMPVGGRTYLWVGTAGGLHRFDLVTSEFTRYSVDDGLPSDYIECIVSDHNSNIWISTSKGISRYNPERNLFRNYDVQDGLPGEVFSDACFRNAQGEIFLGGLHGLVMFHPDSIHDNNNIPPIALTKFNVFGKAIRLDTAITEVKTLTLAYDQNFFSIEFASLDFTAPDKNHYAYMLEGLDLSWQSSQNRRFASYTNVSPGEYVLRIRGTNNDGVWNEAGYSLPIMITPPYWETWWFRTIVAAVVILMLAGAYHYRVSKLLEMERLRVRIASDLHDDIGSSLSGIALLTDMVRRRLPADAEDQQHLMNASTAARHTADALKDIVWIINPQHDKLDDIVLRMKDSAARLLIGIDYSFNCPPNTMENVLDMEFRRNVMLIYKETLNNIAKYSRATEVDIVVGQQNGTFSLQVTDNGVGFDLETVRRGNGLNNLVKRAGNIGGSMDIQSAPGKGTNVRLTAKIP